MVLKWNSNLMLAHHSLRRIYRTTGKNKTVLYENKHQVNLRYPWNLKFKFHFNIILISLDTFPKIFEHQKQPFQGPPNLIFVARIPSEEMIRIVSPGRRGNGHRELERSSGGLGAWQAWLLGV